MKNSYQLSVISYQLGAKYSKLKLEIEQSLKTENWKLKTVSLGVIS